MGSGGRVDCRVALANRDTELRVVLDIESITSKTYVLNQLGSQCKGAMFIANGLKDKAWRKLVTVDMNKFLDDYAKAPLDHEAVTNVGMQYSRWPKRLGDFKKIHLVYFFNWCDGLLDSGGNKLEKDKCESGELLPLRRFSAN